MTHEHPIVRLGRRPVTAEGARAALAAAEPIVRAHRAAEQRRQDATGAILAAIVDAGPEGLDAELASASTRAVIAAVSFAVEALDNAGLLVGMEDTDGI